jgi:plasmid replication initiation protein
LLVSADSQKPIPTRRQGDGKAALDRLQSTTVATSIRQPAGKRLHRFSWINEWKEHVRADGRSDGIELILADWLFSGVVDNAGAHARSRSMTAWASAWCLGGP